MSCWIALAIACIPAYAGPYESDSASSQSLTDYLHTHRLPLVGAQVLQNDEGDRKVVLYGFVATPFGKTDAVTKARKFLKEPDISVDNRIKIRPELLSLKSKAPSSAAPPSGPSGPQASPEDLQAYKEQQDLEQLQQQQQYTQQNPDWVNTMIPLLLLGAAIGLGTLGGGSTGFGYSPYYQPSPYNPPPPPSPYYSTPYP